MNISHGRFPSRHGYYFIVFHLCLIVSDSTPPSRQQLLGFPFLSYVRSSAVIVVFGAFREFFSSRSILLGIVLWGIVLPFSLAMSILFSVLYSPSFRDLSIDLSVICTGLATGLSITSIPRTLSSIFGYISVTEFDQSHSFFHGSYSRLPA
eukprot:sb/3473479/